jgi:hypothetical protein
VIYNWYLVIERDALSDVGMLTHKKIFHMCPLVSQNSVFKGLLTRNAIFFISQILSDVGISLQSPFPLLKKKNNI